MKINPKDKTSWPEGGCHVWVHSPKAEWYRQYISVEYITKLDNAGNLIVTPNFLYACCPNQCDEDEGENLSFEDRWSEDYYPDVILPCDKNGWISVQDGLPENKTRVQVYVDNAGYDVHFFLRGWQTKGVTHWQPAPPKP